MLREWVRELISVLCAIASMNLIRAHTQHVRERIYDLLPFLLFFLALLKRNDKVVSIFPRDIALIVWWHTTTVLYLIRYAFWASFMHTRTVFCDRNIILYRNRAYASLLSLAEFHFDLAYFINHTVQQVQGSGGHAARTTRFLQGGKIERI